MNEITFVAGLHGDEYIPVLALASGGTKFIVGNPRALARGTRVYRRDLNRSFGTKSGYEGVRVQELLRQIPEKSLVVDFHTSMAAEKPFVIVVEPCMLDFARTLGIPRIVYMKHNIKSGRALINHRSGVSVEVGTHTDPKSFQRTLDVVRAARAGKMRHADLYEVYDTIRRPGRYTNFKVHADGFIPILAGESAYRFYGLKARRVTSFS